MRMIDADELKEALVTISQRGGSLDDAIDAVEFMASRSKKLLVRTEHVEIEEKEFRGHTYYIVWWFSDGKKEIRGFCKYFNASDAYQAAIDLIAKGDLRRCR